LLGLLFGGTVYLFLVKCLWFPPVLLGSGLILIYGGNSFGHYLLAAKDKRWLRQAFSRYVSSLWWNLSVPTLNNCASAEKK